MSDISKDVAVVSRQQVADTTLTLLLEYCRAQQKIAAGVHPRYLRLWQSITDQVQGGGKRLRPYLTVLSHGAYGGSDDAIYQVAAAWELLHISMLIHDDIIDRDYVRHGQANVAGHYLGEYSSLPEEQQLHYAHSAALMAGDLVLTSAYRLIDEAGLEAGTLARIKAIFYEATFAVIAGELLDTETAIFDTTIDLELIAELKTASYSIVGPLVSGAVLAGASEEQTKLLTQLGNCLGIGFQLADDILGVFGDESQTGKPTDSDLAEGKRTVVITEALKLMSDDDRQQAERLLAHPSAENAVPLKDLINNTSVRVLLAERTRAYTHQANQLIDQLDITTSHQQAFKDLVTLLFERSN